MYTLYYAPDNASLIVRLALEEMGVPYATHLVDRSTNAHKCPDYLALNPRGLIPVLHAPTGPIFETGAILLFLSETHAALAPPPGAPDRAPFLTWLFCLSNGLHTDLRLLFYPDTFAGPDPTAQQALFDKTRARILDHLTNLETLLATGPGWFGGDTPSVFDFYLMCCLRWLAIYPKKQCGWLDLAEFPTLLSLAQSFETRPAVLRASAAEGLGPTPFSAPDYARPPEGSAT